MNILKFNGLDIDPSKIHESTQVSLSFEKPQIQMKEAFGDERFLLPRIEAIHAGATRNDTVYLREKLRGDAEIKSGVYSWLHPYAKPIIYNHDVNTKATGRVHTAAFAEYTQAGRPGIIVVPKITDPEAIDGILGERLLTVSIGAETDSVVCSYCGTDIINEGYCGHMKGDVIEGNKVNWIAGNLWFDELSWVNVPADSDAMIVDSQTSVMMAHSTESKGIITLGKQQMTKESLVGIEKHSNDDIILMEGELAMTEEQIKALQEELEALKAEKAKVEEELATKTSELETSKELAETLKNEKDALTESHEKVLVEKEELVNSTTELQGKLDESTQAISEKEEALTALEEEKTSLTAELQEAKDSISQLETVTESLSSELSESQKDHFATLRLAIGKESTYEEALKKTETRESASIKDAISDMKEDLAKGEVQSLGQLRQSVQPEGQKQKQIKEETLTAEQALKGLFGGSISK